MKWRKKLPMKKESKREKGQKQLKKVFKKN
jgi:hypothetical protein